MQSSFEIAAASGRYSVTVGQGVLKDVVRKYPEAIYLVDNSLAASLPEVVNKRILIEASECNKSLEHSPQIIDALRRLGANRSAHVVAVGGGVIQDIATFVSSIYMRGLPWTYMPTTMLGMVDSCIGGKSAINVLGFKNLVGSFYPPKDVFIDTAFISTLDEEKVKGGLFEAAKICYARSYDQFLSYLRANPGFPLTQQSATDIILISLTNKKWFIEIDEFDQNERLLLNFGHTFGHALEAGTDFGVSHGIAVGLGMLAAVEFSRQQNKLNLAGISCAQNLVAHIHAMLSSPVVASPPRLDLGLILEKFQHDKKHNSEYYRVVVPVADGSLALINLARTDETNAAILSAYRCMFSGLGWAVNG